MAKKKTPKEPYNILVLPAGGARGAFQAAILRYGLPEKKFHAVFGNSVGALNGAMVAQGKLDVLQAIWEDMMAGEKYIFYSDFVKQDGTFNKWGAVKNIFRMRDMQAVASPNPLKNLLIDLVRLKDFETPFFCSSVSLMDQEKHCFGNEDFEHSLELVLAILASCSIPLFFPPVPTVRTKNASYHQLVDGGLRDAAPLGKAVEHAKDLKDKEIHFTIINCHPNTGQPAPRKLNLRTIFSTMFNNMLDEIWKTDFELFRARNNQKGFESFSYEIITPEPQYYMPDAMDFRPMSIRENWQRGVEHATKI